MFGYCIYDPRCQPADLFSYSICPSSNQTHSSKNPYVSQIHLLIYPFSIHIFVQPSIVLSIHPSIHPPICPSVRPSIHPFIHSSIHPSLQYCRDTRIHPSIQYCRDTQIHPFIHPFIYPSIHPSNIAEILRSIHPAIHPFLPSHPSEHMLSIPLGALCCFISQPGFLARRGVRQKCPT